MDEPEVHCPSCGPACDGATASPAAAAAGRAFAVEGLDCQEEIAALRRTVGPLVGGGDRLQFDLLAGHMYVEATHETADDQTITAAVRRAGLRAQPVSELPRASDDGFWRRHGRVVATIASGVLILAGVLAHALDEGIAAALGLTAGAAVPPAAVVLYLLATLAGAAFVLPRALAAARAARPDMNLLMTVAVAGAIGLGEVLEAASVAFLFALALLLESASVGRARRAVRELLDLAPRHARVLESGSGRELDLPPEEVPVGAVVLVRAGERVPLDGQIIAGEAAMDTSPVTGEAKLADVGPGDEVFAGTISADGAIEVRVLRPASDTVLARIVRRVAEAGRRRAKAERWVDSFARVYTPAVLGAAVFVLVVPPLLGAGTFAEWFYRSLVLLVIGCPCALVISTPVSVVAGLTAAARHGVLVKGGDILEIPGKLAAIAFDKTGTLTRGTPRVVEILPSAGVSRDDLLATAAALEQRSTHPIARAVVRAAADAGITPAAAERLRTLPGRGVEGTIGGRQAWLGSRRLLGERGHDDPALHDHADRLAAAGLSVIAVGLGEGLIGLIGLGDGARTEAAGVVADLRSSGIARIALLTGDNRETAAAVGRAVGITEVHASLLPEDKINVVETLRREAGLVGFVGDGINDAPALAAADLGIALGEGASQAAVETADVALLAADLTRVPWLVRHSRRVLAIIRVNVAFALLIKAAFVIATLAGYASLWAAIAADMGASLLVIANSLRLLR